MTKIKNSFFQKGKDFLKKLEKPAFAKEKGGVLEAKKILPPKTGLWRSETPEVDKNKCVGCGICVEFCPEAALEVREKKGEKKVKIDYDFCKGCGICTQVCPFKAIQ